MRAIVVGVLVAAVSPPALVSAQFRVGPVAGLSLLEQKDTSLSHGPLRDEVTVGRTWLAGAIVDLRFSQRHSLAFEFVYGPYHNDVDRYCIVRLSPASTCEPGPDRVVSHAFLYGMQYAYTFGRASWRPYVGGGFGIKRYAYQTDYDSDRTLPAITAAAGVESNWRTPLRIEIRSLFVSGHPFLSDKNEFELQARVAVLLAGRR